MRDGRRRALMPALVLASMVTAVVSSLGAPLVDRVAETQDVSLSTAQWSLTVTLLSGAIAVPILGRLGSHRHRRSVVLGALAVTALGTLIALVPLGFPGIVCGRLLQGVGMGIGPVAIAIARDVLPLERRAGALSLLAVCAVIGAGLGYPISSLLATVFGLNASYLFGFVVVTISLLLAFYAVPGPTKTEPEPRVDWWGTLLLSVGTGTVLLGVTEGREWGWLSPATLALFACGFACIAAWIRRSLRIPNPLIDLRLAVRAGVLASNVSALIAGTGIYMLISLVTLIVQAPAPSGGFAATPLVAGLMLVPYSIASFFGSRVNLAVARRIPADLLLPIGFGVYTVAMLLLAAGGLQLWMVGLAMLLAGVGSGSTFAVMPGLLLRHASPTESSSAVSANQLLRNIGFSTGSALAATILAFFIPLGGVDPAAVGFTAVAVSGAGLMLGAGVMSLILTVRDRRNR